MSVSYRRDDDAAALRRRRREQARRATSHLDLRGGRGLEIGPLSDPIVAKDQAEVYYADLFDSERLRAHYARDPNVSIEHIVDVDYPLTTADGQRSLSAAAAPRAPYDWIIASHVLEHVPDLIGFLREVATLLAPVGRLSLIIPDHRYSFDALRPPTTVGEMLLAHDNADTRPSVRAVFDHLHLAVDCSVLDLWQGESASHAPRRHTFDEVQRLLQRYHASDDHIDAHVWLFRPDNFISQMHTLALLGLLDFTIVSILPTIVNDAEFFVTLEHLPAELPLADRAQRIATGFPEVTDNVLPGITYRLSERELRAVRLKRKTITTVRRALGRRQPEQSDT